MNHPVQDPIAEFKEALARAKIRETRDATAMTLATVSVEGRPSARIVLLKAVDERGFVFYTNFRSRKGREIVARPFAALCFHWPKGEEQVRIEGRVQLVSDAEADAYFASRPRGSQIGAWASEQSDVVASREELEKSFAAEEERFKGKEVPRPPHWSGFRVVAERIEFWFGRDDRMHDRFVYERTDVGYKAFRLSP
ncbi:MAG TPA: pyridoxamine 5'-phosphate oxidase [Polyangium sp.]|nr:pyridoxamine 5'-phosphate oxidase [Polyangium sp.]